MSRKITAANVFDELEVDLWGNEYKLRFLTRSVTEKYDAARQSAREADHSDNDASVKASLKILACLLEPVGDAKPADEVLLALWEKDELGMDWLLGFTETLNEESEARRRPTSPSGTSN